MHALTFTQNSQNGKTNTKYGDVFCGVGSGFGI